jgi:minor extracellular serine protease Vpr
LCDDKIVDAHWFVDGFGADRVRSGARLSPLDDDGHGTLMASIAAGNAGVSVKVPGQRAGLYAGAAPQARLAVYKACWTAPDPRDDGCSSADLVTAIDRAVADRVDVLNLSVDGPTDPDVGVDTVERALLGAAEADVVVVAAAGNRGTRAYAAHASPWVTSVGGTTGATRRGAVVAPGLRLAGAMAARTAVRPARLVLGARVASAGATASQSRFCQPGSLDAALVSGRIVVCERGRIGRVDKSEAVARADGVGMVLVNTSRGQAIADFHSVPTVHLTKDDGHRLVRWMRAHPGRLGQLRPDGVQRTPERLVAWTSSGDPTGAFVKPDVVATAVGVLGATPPSHLGRRWDLGSGTSVAAARTSGVAAALLSRHDWSAAEVRSAIATAAGDVAGDPSLLRLGAGRTRARPADRPGLVFRLPLGDYRAWLDGDLDATALNTPSVLLQGTGSVTRTVTNVGTRAMYFSSTATGFGRHQVSVTPAAISLAPGESSTFTVRVAGSAGPQPLDDGWVTWRGANGNRVRIPVVIVR